MKLTFFGLTDCACGHGWCLFVNQTRRTVKTRRPLVNGETTGAARFFLYLFQVAVSCQSQLRRSWRMSLVCSLMTFYTAIPFFHSRPRTNHALTTRRGNSNLDYALEATGTGATAHFSPNGCGFSRKLKKALVHLQKEADLDMLEGMLKASGWRIQQ